MGILKETVKKLPIVAELVKERDKLFAELSAISPNGSYKFYVPPGHFFSPLPALEYVTQPGDFQIMIGAASNDIRLKRTFELTN